MGIFTSIKEAIFGKAKAAPAPAPAPVPETVGAPAAQAEADVAVHDVPAEPQHVDIEAVLTEMAQEDDRDLNWRSSIVDLMKLVGLDSSLDERKELAAELGYTGDLDGSAEMNIWLHKRVMRELAENGGKVPANLLD
jgi:hypothetical protein